MNTRTTIPKRILSVMLSILMVLSMMSGLTITASAADDYLIYNADDLMNFAAHVNSGNKGTNGKLMANINMSGKTWTPIASTALYHTTTTYSDKGYTGTFDGQGYVISNLTVKGSSTEDKSFGLFGTLSGTVKNLGMYNFKYTGAGKDSRVGTVAGQMLDNSLIEKCYTATGNINTTVNTTHGVAGGIAGCNYAGIIRDCFQYNYTINAGRKGGIVGDNYGDINNSNGSDRPGVIENCYTDYGNLSEHSAAGREFGECGVSDTRFTTGEIAYKLNYSVNNGTFKQTIGSAYPSLTGSGVYAVKDCFGTAKSYTNNEADALTSDHKYGTNGKCSVCGIKSDGIYYIANANDLFNFATYVNASDSSANAKLTADIDLANKEWTSIGSERRPFTGTFDGQGYTIKNYKQTIRIPGSNGFFSMIQDATVKNFTISGQATTACVYNGGNIGVVGMAKAVNAYCYITNVNSKVNFTMDDNYTKGATGGIVGNAVGKSSSPWNYVIIERCTYSGKMNLGNQYCDCTGGIVGYIAYTSVVKTEKCLFAGSITTEYKDNIQVGGILGYNRGANYFMNNCLSVGTITVVNTTFAGQLAGRYLQTSSNGANRVDTVMKNNYYRSANSLPAVSNTSGMSYSNIEMSDFDTFGDDNAKSVTDTQLKSGEIAYKLGSGWGQKIGTDSNPVVGGNKVYYGYTSCADNATMVYTNTSATSTKPAHKYTNGSCSVCKKACSHSWSNGICTICKKACSHSWQNSTCTICGVACKHNYENGKCTICNKACSHSWEDGKCTVCSKACSHSWEDGKCTVCSKACEHNEVNGTCTICNKIIFEHKYTNGFCTECEAYEPATLTTDKHDITGDGKNDTVYEISNAGQIYWFAEFVNSGNTSANAVLTANIVVNEGTMSAETDSTSVRHWTPIGNYDKPYAGTFNGNNHTVSGIYFNNAKISYVGLFGYTDRNSVIENTGVINSYFNGDSSVGGVVGINDGTVRNCYNTGEVSGNENCGGVVADNSGTITNCYNTGKVNCNSRISSAGGVVYYNTGTIKNSYNTGEVSGNEDCGGVVGENWNTITNCYNTGKVSGDEFVGGVVGDNWGRITNCYNTGEVVGDYYVGGVTSSYSRENSRIINCFYLADSETDNFDDTTATTADQFASGEVAYLLQGDQTEQIWGQDINNGEAVQKFPTFTGAKVYQVKNCKDETVYSNTDKNLDHKYENNKCTLCGKACEHKYENSKCTLCGKVCEHKYTNGFCTECKAYEPATLTTDKHDVTGDGKKDTVYEISNAGQLYWFAEFVNSGNTSANAVLAKNIDVNPDYTFNADGTVTKDGKTVTEGFREWEPIGDSENRYSGIFDGQNHTISGLYCKNSDKYCVGLFGYTNMGTIKNLGIINNYFYGLMYIGGVVGYSISSTISNSYNTGTVSAVGFDSSYIGGIVGVANWSIVIDCYNTGTINVEIYLCNMYAGGIVGENGDGDINSCYNTGRVAVQSEFGKIIVGGIVGENRGEIHNCYNTGTVSVDSGEQVYVGGIVGTNHQYIDCCYNIGTVSGKSEYSTSDVGAIVSNSYALTSVFKCYYLSVSETDSCDGTTAKTADQFASGEVAYLLQGKQTEQIWGQELNKDKFPVLGGEKVYYVIPCVDESCYSNAATGNHTVKISPAKDATCTKTGLTECKKCSRCGKTLVAQEIIPAAEHSFENGKCTVCGAEPTYNPNVVYFIPKHWEEADAWFAVLAWNDNGDSKFVKLQNENGIYFAEIGEYIDMIFCRMDPEKTAVDSDSVWNRTNVLTIPKGYNCFTVNDHEYDNANGIWSEYLPVKDISVTGDINLALEEINDNIYTGVVELQADTYSFNINDDGTTLGFNGTYTDTATIDYSAGTTEATKLNATGGKYTFTYNATTKELEIEYEPVLVFGDANGNGYIELIDVIFVLEYIVGEIALNEVESLCADVDSNGTISVLDAVLIQKMLLGIV